ncbi:MAG: NAD-dependent epimerase/dehydratase family protein [Gammaproteobacteria bacterium]|nr:NAD-dependent epimerase/dehydratase family protein [Gammaproteobacteria bacterium]NIN61669.1 NAD-dependent epimerase/dehydratase family protein [Gammaproteobacteria bacterium]NIO63463.1 NAD-dependent epimerase/dehydratase family protein [Gammaproteobacteria bacterium]NIQ19397.1 NAD-dependent epimerase/dehydratase family protein [Gammaproteobacteria bacterium]NIT05498.1 NAD-dependent epimerase/dehydratase family protein [Gammaproteobacteria bacterium]
MILVTGGAGFIGSHLVTQLLDEGEQVRVLEKPGASVEHLPLERIELVSADIRDQAAVDAATKGCDYVYHLAADPNLWRKDTAEFDAINYHGALNVINAALKNGARRVVHTSTESILTSKEFSGGSVEHLDLKASDMMGPYCLSKFRADKAALEMANNGAEVIVVCPTLPVGPGDRALTPPTRMALAFCRGELPAYLDCRFNLVDARDVATGMIAAMKKGRPGVRYLLGGQNYRLADWLKVLGKEVGRPVPRFTVPYSLALTVAWFSEYWARYVTGKMPMATVTGVRLTRRCMYFDPTPSLKELGLNPRPVTESARDAVAWFRAEGLI